MDNHNTGNQLPYEDKPLRLKPVLIAVVLMVVVGAFVHFLVWAEFSALDRQRKSQDPRVSPLAPARQIPPGPHLEAVRPAMPGAESEPLCRRIWQQSARMRETCSIRTPGWMTGMELFAFRFIRP